MKTPKVYFVGAGPGDPELITVKGRRLLEEADLIIYTGSLVNKEILSWAKDSAQIHNSAGMTLPEVFALLEKGIQKKQKVVRLHTGDPSLYGAIGEQIGLLEEKKISYTVVPGVSSFTAAAAALGKELTLPGVTQSVICTRLEGRTPVPEKESLNSLASHGATMAIFLSVHMIDQVVLQLKEHYPRETKAAVVFRASWPDQEIVRGTLDDIGEKVKTAGIDKTAQIMIGDFLDDQFENSLLYDPRFSHGCRKATNG